MEKIIINHSVEYLHESLGISDTRADEIKHKMNHLIENVTNNGVLNFHSTGVNVSLSKLLDLLLNNIAQNDNERAFVMFIAPQIHKNIHGLLNDFTEKASIEDDMDDIG